MLLCGRFISTPPERIWKAIDLLNASQTYGPCMYRDRKKEEKETRTMASLGGAQFIFINPVLCNLADISEDPYLRGRHSFCPDGVQHRGNSEIMQSGSRSL
jgi:hypothetical protein